ncbi:LPO_1073/Vpar_1526 family protein [Salipiger bermudensis]|uniref:LPO_1073/Vpar_1526 family protein n=1 Tax=Salipiger bermudensis TaxID=344736 RepID=UPI001CD5A32C|nr:LPO_1073/Vpar_1526 family protein [Salipiger bermudensis]MCA1286259.1 hypothetical protein [Salipiger bermudensis]
MANDRLNQKVGEHAVALQAQRDINVGASISEVMDVVAQSIQVYTEVARAHVNDRLAELEKKLTEKFSVGDPGAVKSLADPDVQGALYEAQKAYVRSDDSELHNVLTDLVYRRAVQERRDRIALAINDAIEKSSMLTRVDFANLALIFFLGHVRLRGKLAPSLVAASLKQHLSPLLSDVDFSEDSMNYLYSRGVLLGPPSDTSYQAKSLARRLVACYPEIYNEGFQLDEIESFHPDVGKLLEYGILWRSPFSEGAHFIALSDDAIDELAERDQSLSGLREAYVAQAKKRLVRPEHVISETDKKFAGFSELCANFDGSPMSLVGLSSTGIAIAHSYLVKEASFSGDLKTWIRA